MSDYKTGDVILASDHKPVEEKGRKMIFLCSVSSSKHLCVTKEEWEEEDFNSVTEYKYICKPRTIIRVRKASEIVQWLEDNGYHPTEQGSWISMKVGYLVFSKNMFIECGKNFDNVEHQKRFMEE